MARDGEAFQAGASLHRRRQRGETVLLRKLPGADEYTNWAELGFEIPEGIPLCPQAALEEIWANRTGCKQLVE